MLKRILYLTAVFSISTNILIAQSNFWEEVALPGTVNPIPTCFTSTSNGDVYCGTNSHGVFKSTDNGSTWTQVFSTQWNVESLGANSIDDIFAGTTGGVYRSSNSGASWPAIGCPTSFSMLNIIYALGINSSDELFGATNYGIYISTDNGAIWNSTVLDTPYFEDICIKPSDDIFVSTAWDGIFVSRDNGDTWTAINTGLPPHPFYITMAILSIDFVGDTLYCGVSSNRGVYKSTDNGSNWFSSGLDTSSVTCLAIDSNGYIYAGTNLGGAYLSNDHANTWTGINSGLTNDHVTELFITPDGHILAGTYYALFRSTQTIVSIDHMTTMGFSLSQNYPNPFNPTTTLKYNLPETSDITLNIFDITGRNIKQWSVSNQQSGWHEVIWDGTDTHGNIVSTGVYIYSLKAGDFIDTKKMVFMK